MHADTKGTLSSTARHTAQIGLNEGVNACTHTPQDGQFIEYVRSVVI